MALNLIYLEGDGFGLCKLDTLQLISFNFPTSIFQTEVLLYFLGIYCTLMQVVFSTFLP